MKNAIVAVLLCCAACGGVPEGDHADDGVDTSGVPLEADDSALCRAACLHKTDCEGSGGNAPHYCYDQCMTMLRTKTIGPGEVVCLAESRCTDLCSCGYPGFDC